MSSFDIESDPPKSPRNFFDFSHSNKLFDNNNPQVSTLNTYEKQEANEIFLKKLPTFSNTIFEKSICFHTQGGAHPFSFEITTISPSKKNKSSNENIFSPPLISFLWNQNTPISFESVQGSPDFHPSAEELTHTNKKISFSFYQHLLPLDKDDESAPLDVGEPIDSKLRKWKFLKNQPNDVFERSDSITTSPLPLVLYDINLETTLGSISKQVSQSDNRKLKKPNILIPSSWNRTNVGGRGLTNQAFLLTARKESPNESEYRTLQKQQSQPKLSNSRQENSGENKIQQTSGEKAETDLVQPKKKERHRESVEPVKTVLKSFSSSESDSENLLIENPQEVGLNSASCVLDQNDDLTPRPKQPSDEHLRQKRRKNTRILTMNFQTYKPQIFKSESESGQSRLKSLRSEQVDQQKLNETTTKHDYNEKTDPASD